MYPRSWDAYRKGPLKHFASASRQSYLLPAALAVLTFVLRVPFWKRPIDMDEGLYAYGGWQLLEGLVLYRDLWDFKPPGIYFLNALVFWLSGPEAVNMYVCAATFMSLASLAVYKIAQSVWSTRVAVLSGLVFAFMSASPYIQGCGLNTEVFMITPMIWSLFWLLRASQSGHSRLYLISGLMAGMAVLFKQVAGVSLLLGLVAVLWSADGSGLNARRRLYCLAWFIGGAAVPWVLVGLYFLFVGALGDFLFWQVVYPFSYLRYTYVQERWQQVSMRMLWALQGMEMLWLFSAVGLARLLKGPSTASEKLLGLFFPLSVLGVSAGWNFFAHYFVQMVPAVALFSGRGMHLLYGWVCKRGFLLLVYLTIAVMLLAGLFFAKSHYKFFLVYDGEEISINEWLWAFPSRPVFGTSRSLGLELRRLTNPTDLIFVWKHHPEINFYALRRTPIRAPIMSLPHLDTLVDEAMQDLEKRNPEYIVIFNPLPSSGVERLISFLHGRYDKVYGIDGLVLAMQGVYKRKPDE